MPAVLLTREQRCRSGPAGRRARSPSAHVSLYTLHAVYRGLSGRSRIMWYTLARATATCTEHSLAKRERTLIGLRMAENERARARAPRSHERAPPPLTRLPPPKLLEQLLVPHLGPHEARQAEEHLVPRERAVHVQVDLAARELVQVGVQQRVVAQPARDRRVDMA